ncbi:right-handed parallel beta-helix repeat-containing protein [Trinickia violacea]|uniref:Right-handed parallel beta-helix repeat-containing protein n=1 Tax=Trinickia violacea TaxID=2571746 RepID=A0A4P8J0B7_9BURK|nr:right-handed parallel beta-helix repeat-containing protein [Trinickia violacea]QCP55092.1 right-handed parallel beta-helix repeat-containing protein [Trinickia violacea]
MGQGISVSWDNNSVIEENTSYNNYGEGIGTFLSVGVAILNNTVYDNFSVEIYLDNASNATVNANSIYNTGNSGFFRNGSQASSIQLARETYSQSEPLSNLKITNNVAINGSFGLFYGNYGSGGGIQSSVIANNTFASANVNEIYIDPSSGHSGNTYANNIVYEAPVDNRTLVAGSNSGATFLHNNWFGGSAGAFSGVGDVVADPQFVNAGALAATDYVLQSTSLCKQAGVSLSQVATDYFGQSRVVPPTIGAFN